MLNEETNELNSEGRLELKNIIDIYQKKNGDEDGDKNDKVNEDKNIKENNGKDNLNIDKEKNNVINLTLNIDDLQTKNDEFLLTDTKKKWSIKNLQIWKNYRTYLYLALIVLIILIVEFLI